MATRAKKSYLLLVRFTRAQRRELARVARHYGCPRAAVINDLVHAEARRLGVTEAHGTLVDRAIENPAESISAKSS